MPPLFRYHLQHALSRLHRARVMLHSRGWKAVLARATSTAPATGAAQASPALPAPAPLSVARAPRALRLLWVDERLPEPNRDSGSLRMFNLMRLLVAMGHRVDILATEQPAAPARIQELRGIGVECADAGTGRTAAAGWFLAHGTRYDGVIVSRYHLAWPWLPLIRRANPRALAVLDTVDLHHVRESREAALRPGAALRRAAAATRRHELRAIRDADVAWVVSDVERRFLEEVAPGARVEVISNVHETARRTRERGVGDRIVFVGGAQHPPNADAVRWLLAGIMPALLRRRPACELHLVGAGLERCAEGIAMPPNTVFHGHVHDLGALLDSCQAGVAPLRFGAGVKGKINQYMAFGLPTVSTPNGVEGMHLEDGRDVLLAHDAAGFADAVARVLGDEALWSRLSVHGHDNVRRHFSIESAIPGILATFGTDPRTPAA